MPPRRRKDDRGLGKWIDIAGTVLIPAFIALLGYVITINVKLNKVSDNSVVIQKLWVKYGEIKDKQADCNSKVAVLEAEVNHLKGH